MKSNGMGKKWVDISGFKNNAWIAHVFKNILMINKGIQNKITRLVLPGHLFNIALMLPFFVM